MTTFRKRSLFTPAVNVVSNNGGNLVHKTGTTIQ